MESDTSCWHIQMWEGRGDAPGLGAQLVTCFGRDEELWLGTHLDFQMWLR